MTDSQNNLQVRADKPRNRLYVTVGGKIGKADLDGFFEEMQSRVADVRPGFAVITDLTDCHHSHLAAIPIFRKIMNYLIDNGVREVIRVVNTKNLIYRQALNLASRIQGYQPAYVKTLDEAEALLSRPKKRTDIRFSMSNKEVRFGTDSCSSAGSLIDLSLGGCSLATDAPLPSLRLKLRLELALLDEQSVACKFDFTALVVRVFDAGFAVAFLGVEDSVKEKLWQCLSQESKLDRKPS